MSHHQHHSASDIPADNNDERYRATRNVTLIGAFTNAALAIIQFTGGVLTQSQALIADSIHTVSDLASDFIVLIAARFASKDADDDHPYGHGRIETLATILLGVGLFLVGIGIAADAWDRIRHPERLFQPTAFGIVFAAIAIVAKEGLYQLTRRVGQRIHSSMLIANAWHHRSDAISSIAVLIGIAGAVLLGIPWLDAAAAIFVSGMIMFMGLKMVFESFSELIDTALDPERIQQMRDFIRDQDGVESVHALRTRRMGGQAYADVHVQVGPRISVSEGHHIAERVMYGLKQNFTELQDITVHIDPEDDECASPCEALPSRQQLEKKLIAELQPLGFSEHDRLEFHYLNGLIHLEIFLQPGLSEDQISNIRQHCLAMPEIGTVAIFFGHSDNPG